MGLLEETVRSDASPLGSLALMIDVYLLVSLLQEFTSRSMLQTSFALLLRGPRASLWAVELFAALWLRHPSLLAVSLAHFLAGFWCIEFLGALALLGMKV